ncbi:MAG: outer membrane lipoprotein carrier protein LolA [Rhodospirillales bacterium]|nr:outer membrane lipoprotein carrier protein LolA [Rhodospirillales bacterium]
MTELTRRAALRCTITGLGLCALPLAGGLAPAQAALKPEEEQAVRKAERYLNRISTLRSRFVQISSNGAYAEGEVVVRRPGRLRFEYDPPHPVLLIADGTNLLYYDKELKQASFIPLWETPLWFLIRKKVELSDNVEVTQIRRATGTLRMTLQESGGGDAGAVTLVFSDRPFALRKWEVIDAQGVTTQVALINPQFDIEVDDDVFDYGDLDTHGLQRKLDRR